jgi:CoA:oxalate CoA-transferase
MGVTVLDFTRAHSGPFCTMNLGDFGARVIKIERGGSGDQARFWTPMKNNYSGYFSSINRNKESITLDMGSEEGAAVIKRMVKDADIVVENFKCGTMEKFGLGYEDLKKINPAIIFASISGFGQNGPMKKLPAYDNVAQSMAGVHVMSGLPEGEHNGVPTRIGPPIADNFTGLTMDVAICMAYYNRLVTGEGQFLDVAMLDTMFEIMEPSILFYSVLGKKLKRSGDQEPWFHAPYDCYACSDGFFTVGVDTEDDWKKFCMAVGMSGLENDARFADNAKRCENCDALTDILKPFFAGKARADLAAVFDAVNIPNSPVLSIGELRTLPQSKERGLLIKVDDPGVGEYEAIANPIKMEKTPAVLQKAAPLLGEDTDKVLKEFGYTEKELSAFRANGTI